MKPRLRHDRAALVIAHPGHELLVHGWVAAAKPVVMVLTDGSGGNDAPRIAATRALLERLGAPVGAVFGEHRDKQVYAALLARDAGFFRALVDRMVAALSAQRVTAIVSDAIEHFNPVHDLAHAIADAAAAALAVASGGPVARYAFAIEHADEPLAQHPQHDIVVRLDPGALAEKHAAARANSALAREVADLSRARNGHAIECRRVNAPYGWPAQLASPAFYEEFGTRRLREGRHTQLITYRDHVRPTALATLRMAMPADT